MGPMIAARPDLLVIGGLTIDRFADGSSAPGGSVLHIARAMAPRSVRLAVLTVAGPEPEARAALDELRGLTVALGAREADATATYRHRDTDKGRRLGLERRGGQVAIAEWARVAGAGAVLVAPIAGEVLGDELSELAGAPVRAAILQGWLRSLDQGAEVRPLPLAALGAPLIDALGQLDLLVASREDLLAESGDPRAQLAALRHAFGPTPRLVLTDGIEGLWLDEPAVHHLSVRSRVTSVSTVGAGDILAALLTLAASGRVSGLDGRVSQAMRTVAEILEERQG